MHIEKRSTGFAVIETFDDDTKLVWRTLPTRPEAEAWLAEACPEDDRKKRRK
jgi:hypothetical protein